MVPSDSATLLIGIPLDTEKSYELLSWAINLLAHPNDNILALHVLVKEETKKQQHSSVDQTRFRKAKAFVISVLGEYAKTCQSKQINLEARVAFSSSVGRGLIKEAKSISAEYLLLGRSIQSNRNSCNITSYCFGHAPKGCSVVSIGRCLQPLQNSTSISKPYEDTHELNSTLSKVNIKKLIVSKTNREKASPNRVLDASEGESNSTEEDSFSFGESSTTESPPPLPSRNLIKQVSPIKFVSSFFRSPFDSTRGKGNDYTPNNQNQQPLLRCFSYEEIASATNNFHSDNIIGRGGYSEVYRGDLPNGRTIAVKRLANDNTNEDKEKEFLTELGITVHVCHVNTSNLVGCCIENGFHLIFNFCPNGNLSTTLHGKSRELLDWPTRYKIALGVARGLHYLHKCCKHRIIHRDIKASNILLGHDYEPQITDFGLAKWLPNKWTHHAVIPIEGTFGYLAPEYFMHGIVDEKTDVFAFGVLLLEVITGRRPIDSSKQNLLQWAKPLMQAGDVVQLADPRLWGKYDMDQMRRLVLTASYCVRQSSIWRPSMSEVLELLTNGDDSEVARTWRKPKFTADEMDHYSLDFDFVIPTEIILELEED